MRAASRERKESTKRLFHMVSKGIIMDGKLMSEVTYGVCADQGHLRWPRIVPIMLTLLAEFRKEATVIASRSFHSLLLAVGFAGLVWSGVCSCSKDEAPTGNGPHLSPAGAWSLTIHIQGQEDQRSHVMVAQSGSSVTLTFTCQSDMPVGTGTYQADSLKIVFDLGGGQRVTLSGTWSGAAMAGVVGGSLGTGDWTMTRTDPLDCSSLCDSVVVPVFVDADFMDLQKIAEISRFRSAAGHDYSDGCESCRSMKHYYAPYPAYRNNGVNNIYSPVAGTIVSITAEGHGEIGRAHV
jgi:hypothetical protein